MQQRLVKVGGSLYLRIPFGWIQMHDLQRGDLFVVEDEGNALKFTIVETEKKITKAQLQTEKMNGNKEVVKMAKVD